MNYKLECEGIPLNEELRDSLLLCGRELVVRTDKNHFVKITVKQIDAMVQARVEISLQGRKISALVRRRDPIEATQAAVKALCKALDQEQIGNPAKSGLATSDNMCSSFSL
jgi:hypothetical protein